ncbi:MAG: ABC transporter permease [Candidatus Krumholzibacteriia bacterium]
MNAQLESARTKPADRWASVPGWTAWRCGRRSRAAVQLATALLPVLAAVGLLPRLIRSWDVGRTEIVLAGLTLVLLPLSGLAWARFDAARQRRDRSGASQWERPLDRLLHNRVAVAGGLLVLVLGACALLAPLLAPYDPLTFTSMATTRLQPPGGVHWLGTDQIGRDVLSRLLYGARISLAVGLVAVALAISIGTLVGLLAGYMGGWVDTGLMRLVDLLIAFPRIFLLLLIISLWGSSIWLVISLLGITGWMTTARLVRAQVLSVREMDYVQAACALGLPVWRILLRHVLPNTAVPVVISATLMVGNTILAESVLSFLGLGVQVPTPSWGAMLQEGQAFFPGKWWLSTFPGLAITLTVIGYNLLGDGLRDALDPRLHTGESRGE